MRPSHREQGSWGFSWQSLPPPPPRQCPPPRCLRWQARRSSTGSSQRESCPWRKENISTPVAWWKKILRISANLRQGGRSCATASPSAPFPPFAPSPSPPSSPSYQSLFSPFVLLASSLPPAFKNKIQQGRVCPGQPDIFLSKEKTILSKEKTTIRLFSVKGEKPYSGPDLLQWGRRSRRPWVL